jgi:hypothetical protein
MVWVKQKSKREQQELRRRFVIPAWVRTDDRVAEADFDAVLHFERESDDELFELAAIGFGGSCAGDAVAMWSGDPQVGVVLD